LWDWDGEAVLGFWLKVGITMTQGQNVCHLHKLQRPGNLNQEEFAAFVAM
jgi:hypothetical protein